MTSPEELSHAQLRVDQLNQQFQSASVSFDLGRGSLTRCRVRNRWAEAEIYLHGAHLTHFRPHDQTSWLWMSPLSEFDAKHPIRGGIPICWPWFGPHNHQPEFPQHGFARTSGWRVRAVLEMEGSTEILLGLTSSPQTAEFLDGEFDARCRISLGESLTVELGVTNTGDRPLVDVGCALHSYFRVSAIENVRLLGLQDRRYLDKLTGEIASQSGELIFEKETDRVYLDGDTPLTLVDRERPMKFGISSTGSRSTVVWNPWVDKSKRMADFPDDGYREMVCVETANAWDDVRTIDPGKTHLVSQTVAQVESP
ncbi:MAG: D-hexose-6-phosphate mutarotase [Planctomycetota bacterium]|nr:D-hexose-6-phosphate mutarotase [Planctomycetota bacterium]